MLCLELEDFALDGWRFCPHSDRVSARPLSVKSSCCRRAISTRWWRDSAYSSRSLGRESASDLLASKSAMPRALAACPETARKPRQIDGAPADGELECNRIRLYPPGRYRGFCHRGDGGGLPPVAQPLSDKRAGLRRSFPAFHAIGPGYRSYAHHRRRIPCLLNKLEQAARELLTASEKLLMDRKRQMTFGDGIWPSAELSYERFLAIG